MSSKSTPTLHWLEEITSSALGYTKPTPKKKKGDEISIYTCKKGIKPVCTNAFEGLTLTAKRKENKRMEKKPSYTSISTTQHF